MDTNPQDCAHVEAGKGKSHFGDGSNVKNWKELWWFDYKTKSKVKTPKRNKIEKTYFHSKVYNLINTKNQQAYLKKL
jgi:hypothetical protein